ncbi:hypothetical protein GIB67_028729 [Kingdonia uniflora]|uniref:BZIP domain-containing protein n=1 Tax=Kingdonia uniflora TaxID=39325 RepID=A0A7J7NA38_9MAGN|nr:hypothetical protein GIB67_028729 [Kingdonia uniflora]
MWSSGGEEINNIYNSSSSQSSNTKTNTNSSSSSSHSPFSNLPRRRTMEEVWNDINLSSMHQNPTNEHYHHHQNNPIIGMNNIQEFLARPFSKDQQTGHVNVISSNNKEVLSNAFGSNAPKPPIVLCLNSEPDFQYLENNDHPLRPQSRFDNNHSNDDTSFASPFDGFASPSGFYPFSKRRAPEDEDNTGDRRLKRMIKNRDSAARSRARKQEIISSLPL